MPASTCSALEARLGMQLLSRTTRRQHMTPFGEDYYARCRRSCGWWRKPMRRPSTSTLHRQARCASARR
jgi:DNA-binding transcriptional LysR family regulator